MEGQIEGKMVSIDGQMATLRRALEQAEAQLPVDGKLVKETFSNITVEIKRSSSRRVRYSPSTCATS